jgi:hypothetical protein
MGVDVCAATSGKGGEAVSWFGVSEGSRVYRAVSMRW